jgi:hypothetical protein
LCHQLHKLKDIVDHGLSDTASLWPSVRISFGFVHRAAGILDNPKQGRGPAVRRRYRVFLREMRRKTKKARQLKTSIAHFLKVTESYWPGLFHCYDVPDLPRTNNDLEQLFGSTRHHERRCTGRKAASPSLVLRGSVRIVAGLGTRNRSFRGRELAPANPETWRALRAGLERRRHTRALRQRFRRDPEAYLRQLEALLLKRTLPP